MSSVPPLCAPSSFAPIEGSGTSVDSPFSVSVKFCRKRLAFVPTWNTAPAPCTSSESQSSVRFARSTSSRPSTMMPPHSTSAFSVTVIPAGIFTSSSTPGSTPPTQVAVLDQFPSRCRDDLHSVRERRHQEGDGQGDRSGYEARHGLG